MPVGVGLVRVMLMFFQQTGHRIPPPKFQNIWAREKISVGSADLLFSGTPALNFSSACNFAAFQYVFPRKALN